MANCCHHDAWPKSKPGSASCGNAHLPSASCFWFPVLPKALQRLALGQQGHCSIALQFTMHVQRFDKQSDKHLLVG